VFFSSSVGCAAVNLQTLKSAVHSRHGHHSLAQGAFVCCQLAAPLFHADSRHRLACQPCIAARPQRVLQSVLPCFNACVDACRSEEQGLPDIHTDSESVGSLRESAEYRRQHAEYRRYSQSTRRNDDSRVHGVRWSGAQKNGITDTASFVA
jgi:hypothetical protein